MCGICGVYFFDRQEKLDEPVLLSMRDTMTPRGPDDAGTYLRPGVALGHRRLSIIDLTPDGHQPMSNEDGTLWLVFNGEIYNFLELRPELEEKGHRFKSRTDSEVILHAFEEYGERCVEKFNGMFAFAIYNTRDHSLFIARDRLGVKPLYYTQNSRFFAFASSQKALLRHPEIEAEIDPASLSEYLLFEYVPAPRSMIQNIWKLLPGHTAWVKEGKVSIQKYWELDYTIGPAKSLPEYEEELRRLLKASVRRRLVSDVPLGIFLSGGIDSSTILSFMAELGHRPLKSFSIGFNENSFNELHHARKVAKYFGTDHHEMMVTPHTLIELFPKVLEAIDDPLGDPSAVPTFLVSQLARKSVTVCLAGDGGDELFAGYPTYQAYQLWRYYSKLPGALRSRLEKIIFRLPTSFRDISFDYKLKKFAEGMSYPIEQTNFLWKGAFRPDEKLQILSPEMKARLTGVSDYFSIDTYSRDFTGSEPLNRLLFLDTKIYMQDDILAKVDRMSMANSLEVRVPFLDYTVAEFAARLPIRLKLRGLTTKYLLKRAMRQRLPSDIIHRKKKGFGIPFAIWVAEELMKNFILNYFSNLERKTNGILNPDGVHRILDDHLAKRRDNRKLIWTLLVLLAWLQEIKTVKQKPAYLEKS